MTQPAQEQFRDAWSDLSTRLDRAVDLLKELGLAKVDGETADDQAEALRIAYKSAAVKNARVAWASLNQQAARSGDYAGAWRTFTDQVFTDWQNAPGKDFQAGYALVLEYQRGYGAAVDAPPLVALRERLGSGRSGGMTQS